MTKVAKTMRRKGFHTMMPKTTMPKVKLIGKTMGSIKPTSKPAKMRMPKMSKGY